MKLKLALLTTVILIFFYGSLVQAQNSWKTQGLNGKVRSYTENFFDAVKTDKSREKGELQRYAKHKATFDQKGRIVSNTYYSNKGPITIKLRYKYKSNKQIEQL